MKLAIVIPAFNEENTIEGVVKTLLPYGAVIVANDCSLDATAARAEGAGAIVISAKSNGGYDATVNMGFRKAVESGATHIITFDADGQHPASRIPDFIRAFEEGASVVVGVRPRMQRFSEILFDLYYRIRFGVSDPLTGMKGYDLTHFEKIGFFDSIQSIGTELLTKYLLLGLKVKEIGIEIKDREDASRFGSSWRANLKIFSALLRLHRIR
jgi:glycosyltransferase involved in cell wall biosynthesis